MSSADSAGRSDRRFLQFRIHGMDCADEVAILRRRLGPFVVMTLLVVGNALRLLKTRA